MQKHTQILPFIFCINLIYLDLLLTGQSSLRYKGRNSYKEIKQKDDLH